MTMMQVSAPNNFAPSDQRKCQQWAKQWAASNPGVSPTDDALCAMDSAIVRRQSEFLGGHPELIRFYLWRDFGFGKRT